MNLDVSVCLRHLVLIKGAFASGTNDTCRSKAISGMKLSELRYESSALILYKELSTPISQSLSVSE